MYVLGKMAGLRVVSGLLVVLWIVEVVACRTMDLHRIGWMECDDELRKVSFGDGERFQVTVFGDEPGEARPVCDKFWRKDDRYAVEVRMDVRLVEVNGATLGSRGRYEYRMDDGGISLRAGLERIWEYYYGRYMEDLV